MSNVKISALPTGTALVDTDTLPVVRSGVTTAVNTGSLVANVATAQTDISSLKTSRTADEASITTLQGQVVTLQSQAAQFPVSTPLSQSTWSWFNQGSATVTQGASLVTLLSPSATGTNIRGRLRGSYPSGTTTLIVIVKPWFQFAGTITNLGLIGITISDGTKHKIFVAANFNFATGATPPAIWVGKYSSPTSASAATVIDSINISANSNIWLKMVDDTVNQTFSYSLDGNVYVQVLQEARTTFLTPSDIGICVTCQSATQTQGGTIISWSSS